MREWIRRKEILTVAAIALLWLPASAAQAAVVVDLIWTGTTGTGLLGTSSIDAEVGDELILDVIINVGPEGMNAYGVSVAFDTGLNDGLDLVGVLPVLNPAFQFALPPGPLIESVPGIQGEVQTLAAAALFGGFFGPGSFLAAQLFFEVKDSSDLQTFLTPADGFGDLNGILIGDVTLNGAEVIVPEPTTAALLTLGLVGLGVASRRRK